MNDLSLILTGVVVVMGVLASLWGLLVVVAAVARRFAPPVVKPATPNPAASKPTAPPPAPQPMTGVPPHHVAAITAAVAVMTGGRGVITHVVAEPNRSPAWALTGRADSHHTHTLRRGWGLRHTIQSEND